MVISYVSYFFLRSSSSFLIASSKLPIVSFFSEMAFLNAFAFRNIAMSWLVSPLSRNSFISLFNDWIHLSTSIRSRFALSVSSAIIFPLLLAASLYLGFLASSRAITYLEQTALHDVNILAVISISCPSFFQHFQASYSNIWTENIATCFQDFR